ncbi:MAG: hypothetical protein INH06_08455, partial [Cupriavidus sp.]|nr:hypothetical protein [Cupriavidus sp.]
MPPHLNPSDPLESIASLHASLRAGQISRTDLIAQAAASAASPAGKAVFLHTTFDAARQVAQAADA